MQLVREAAGEERRGSKECNLAMILLKAATCGNKAKVKKLLNNGAPADWQEPERGRTALFAAAANGHREVVAAAGQGGQCGQECGD